MAAHSPVTYRRIFRLWVPLAATWLMMSVEGTFLAAVIARLDEPTFNLAAYGVAFAFALIVEAPIIMILSAATALVRDYESFKKLRNFSYTLNLLITLGMLLVLWRPVFSWLSKEVGLGIVPENALARRFREVAGRLNRHVAAAADRVDFLAAGIPLALKSPTGQLEGQGP